MRAKEQHKYFLFSAGRSWKILSFCHESKVLDTCFLCKMWYDYFIVDECLQNKAEILRATVSQIHCKGIRRY